MSKPNLVSPNHLQQAAKDMMLNGREPTSRDDWNLMELVTIAHDYRCVYVLGTPYARKTLLPHVKRLQRFDYLVGDTKPNFPLPAIPIKAELFAPDSMVAFALWYLEPLINPENECDYLDEF